MDDAAQFFHQTIMGFWLAPSLAAAAHLGFADIVAGQPRTAEEISGIAGTDSNATRRLLTALAGMDVFSLDAEGRFGPTPRSALMRRDHPSQIGALLDIGMTGENLAAWQSLVESVRSGKPAFEIRHGVHWVDYLRERPARETLFGAAMTATTRAAEAAILSAFDFGDFRCAVDIGGSHASLIGGLLELHPNARGIVFDLPATIEAGRAVWRNKPFADRLEAAGGDFFKSVPEGDLYLLKLILHDWNDEDSIKILRTVRKSIPPEGRLFIIETILPDAPSPHVGWGMDITMMVCTGGRERSVADLGALLDKAGFSVCGLHPTPSPYSLLEARPN